MARHKPIYTGLKLLPMQTGASRSKTDTPTSWIMKTTTEMANRKMYRESFLAW